MQLSGTIEADGDARKVEIEKVGDVIVLWQDNNQPTSDAVWLTPAMARELRNQLSSMEL